MLTPKQRKLPLRLKKAIVASKDKRMSKAAKGVEQKRNKQRKIGE
jgi:hypothetical protein